MNIFAYKKQIIFALAIITGILLIVSLINNFTQNQTPPEILRSSPINGASNIELIIQPRITFNSEINPEDFSVSSEPPVDSKIVQLDYQTLEIQPQKALTQNTKYTFNLLWKSKHIIPLSFATQKSQIDYEVLKNIKKEIDENYPLAKFTPFQGLGFRVVYSAPMTLQATLSNPNLTSEEVIAEMKVWVTKNGGNAESHKYTVVSSSSTN